MFIEGIVQPKVKKLLNINYPQAIQDVDDFSAWTDLEKFSITSLAHQWILCSEWVPSEWETKQLIKKHHNNPQVTHKTPVHQLKVHQAIKKKKGFDHSENHGTTSPKTHL